MPFLTQTRYQPRKLDGFSRDTISLIHIKQTFSLLDMYQLHGVSAKNSIQSSHIYINTRTKEEI